MDTSRDSTTLLVTTDHGRGPTRHDWTNHGAKVPDADLIWFAAQGPRVPALGVREHVEAMQSQLAATIAQLISARKFRRLPLVCPSSPSRRGMGFRFFMNLDVFHKSKLAIGFG